ncbi:hypothetical protein A3F00_03985 [Candidatus Daviesbacteria bacterium RIFCSPHIGHO2_12_FULL_37_11]|uniref:Regulatory protein RecX n=1 Tax=Candidatus Daviesbacteria bacterium RIFCSPHIGHO2_12_FULL_37_11 TaxID=1797777 RepID=A0A1F5KBV3_9BACT|nr:MAG: hypothetical protein A2111_00190 [Candidatus Daviesbacteria bacterium GWA1_38_6]OGE17448.1 MAG: hypothetical protein A2769_03405 [Candidatus Daviesbacteria bacterium RIFCSPHIGHO2_01_FULL_37_27]OGE38417.1 MAG: hypothetical protein A3F00_03985 [Candidatus Daviesbacteria bacterium RIFCSPHIGHO2_12_FULL_37_11]OGE45736.1 MAG: hypothetical protein A3B39_01950 [Candidatus Daviesbacteria bacterium RIFCSPLOWO2_01_FULL_37_10]
MKITQVEPQKSKGRFNIFLDGQFAFGADEDLVVDNRLVIGKEIAQEDLGKILQEAEVGKLMERMYRLFNIRQRSEKEILDYLKNLSFKRKLKGQEEISLIICTTTVGQLKKKGLINDKEFARSWIESRSKKRGKKLIKMELLQKGISRDIVEDILNDSNHFNKVSEEQVAENLLQKKVKVWKNLPEMEMKKKSTDFLLRRGFEYPVAKLTIEKLLKKE